ncbi:hypothetical protein EYW49_01605 [Siculibacillus lacustris]|uniref:EF-hand domain-containing protein n=2 Tax=Siculibacillus lacustris TaxID=1549641 RepID=A0A4Q9VZK4_9HYPH|nr:hypothetical protein EYW49_01605 [Siculibacillus lacustris]
MGGSRPTPERVPAAGSAGPPAPTGKSCRERPGRAPRRWARFRRVGTAGGGNAGGNTGAAYGRAARGGKPAGAERSARLQAIARGFLEPRILPIGHILPLPSSPASPKGEGRRPGGHTGNGNAHRMPPWIPFPSAGLRRLRPGMKAEGRPGSSAFPPLPRSGSPPPPPRPCVGRSTRRRPDAGGGVETFGDLRRIPSVSRPFPKFCKTFRILTSGAAARFLISLRRPDRFRWRDVTDERGIRMIGSTTSTSQGLYWPRSSTTTTGADKAGATATSSATSSTSSTDPLQALFGTIDSDSSGGVSSTELQSFVDSFSSATRSALLGVQENGTSSTSSTTSTASSSSTSSSTASAFATIDSDGDGTISQSELSSFMQASMPPPPPPPDGSSGSSDTTTSSGSSSSTSSTTTGSTTSSTSTTGSDPASRLMAALDTNGDGSVSQSELEAALNGSTSSTSSSTTTSSTSSSSTSSASDLFSAMDTDGDGSVSQTELASYMKANAPPPPPPPSDQAATTDTTATTATSTSGDSGSSSGGSSGSSGSSSAFSAIDTNKDGTISQAELDAYLAKSATTTSSSTGTDTSSTDSSTSSSTDAASAFSAVIAQMLQQSYQRVGSHNDLQSTLLKSIDAIA